MLGSRRPRRRSVPVLVVGSVLATLVVLAVGQEVASAGPPRDVQGGFECNTSPPSSDPSDPMNADKAYSVHEGGLFSNDVPGFPVPGSTGPVGGQPAYFAALPLSGGRPNFAG